MVRLSLPLLFRGGFLCSRLDSSALCFLHPFLVLAGESFRFAVLPRHHHESCVVGKLLGKQALQQQW